MLRPVVLIVNEGDRFLDDLERTLRTSEEGLEVFRAESADGALAAMESRGIDVIVADGTVRGKDGASLLAMVGARWPATIRFLVRSEGGACLVTEETDERRAVFGMCEPSGGDELSPLIKAALDRRTRARTRELLDRRVSELEHSVGGTLDEAKAPAKAEGLASIVSTVIPPSRSME